jgi:hypothetical protein
MKRFARWRPRTDGQKWLCVLTIAVLACGAAVALPVAAFRGCLLSFASYSIVLGWLLTEGRRGRRERLALAARLDARRPGEVHADIISLLSSGKKIQAIKRYRQLTGMTLHEAKAYIDSL